MNYGDIILLLIDHLKPESYQFLLEEFGELIDSNLEKKNLYIICNKSNL
jgi:hypothetical protein